MPRPLPFFFFFLNDPATTEFYPLPLHDALPIYLRRSIPADAGRGGGGRDRGRLSPGRRGCPRAGARRSARHGLPGPAGPAGWIASVRDRPIRERCREPAALWSARVAVGIVRVGPGGPGGGRRGRRCRRVLWRSDRS